MKLTKPNYSLGAYEPQDGENISAAIDDAERKLNKIDKKKGATRVNQKDIHDLNTSSDALCTVVNELASRWLPDPPHDFGKPTMSPKARSRGRLLYIFLEQSIAHIDFIENNTPDDTVMGEVEGREDLDLGGASGEDLEEDIGGVEGSSRIDMINEDARSPVNEEYLDQLVEAFALVLEEDSTYSPATEQEQVPALKFEANEDNDDAESYTQGIYQKMNDMADNLSWDSPNLNALSGIDDNLESLDIDAEYPLPPPLDWEYALSSEEMAAASARQQLFAARMDVAANETHPLADVISLEEGDSIPERDENVVGKVADQSCQTAASISCCESLGSNASVVRYTDRQPRSQDGKTEYPSKKDANLETLGQPARYSAVSPLKAMSMTSPGSSQKHESSKSTQIESIEGLSRDKNHADMDKASLSPHTISNENGRLSHNSISSAISQKSPAEIMLLDDAVSPESGKRAGSPKSKIPIKKRGGVEKSDIADKAPQLQKKKSRGRPRKAGSTVAEKPSTQRKAVETSRADSSRTNRGRSQKTKAEIEAELSEDELAL